MNRFMKIGIGIVAGFVVAETFAAGLSYFGIDVGYSIIRLFDDSYDATTTPRHFEDDVYLATHRSPVPLPSRDITAELMSVDRLSCMTFAGDAGWQRLQNLYIRRFNSLGLTAPGILEGNCLWVSINTSAKTQGAEDRYLVVRLDNGPTCRFGICSTDIWDVWNGKLLLSIRATKIGVGATVTRGMADVVADDYYLFMWNGEKYVPRYF